MKTSETVAKVFKSLVMVQGEIQNPQNEVLNPFFHSQYASLDAILAMVRPILAKNGLAVIQFATGDGTFASVTTTLLHESGEYIESDPLIIKPIKLDAQAIGSAISYARRYTLNSMLGIAGTNEDDDANSISVAAPKPVPEAPVSTKVSAPNITGPSCPTCKGPLTFMRESTFEDKPINIHKCAACRKLVKLAV
jgi:hypothetical protein